MYLTETFSKINIGEGFQFQRRGPIYIKIDWGWGFRLTGGFTRRSRKKFFLGGERVRRVRGEIVDLVIML